MGVLHLRNVRQKKSVINKKQSGYLRDLTDSTGDSMKRELALACAIGVALGAFGMQARLQSSSKLAEIKKEASKASYLAGCESGQIQVIGILLDPKNKDKYAQLCTEADATAYAEDYK